MHIQVERVKTVGCFSLVAHFSQQLFAPAGGVIHTKSNPNILFYVNA